ALDRIDGLVDQVLGDFADHAAGQFLVQALADLSKGLGIGRNYQLPDAAAQSLAVEPLGNCRTMRQLVEVGAAVALAGRLLVPNTGAEVGQFEIQLSDALELGLERLAHIAHQHEPLPIGESDKGLVRDFHRRLLPSVVYRTNGRACGRCPSKRAGGSLPRPSLVADVRLGLRSPCRPCRRPALPASPACLRALR